MSDEMREAATDALHTLENEVASFTAFDEPDWVKGSIDLLRRALAAAPAEAQQPVAWLIATVEGYSPFASLSERDAEYYAKHGWTVTPLVPQRATPQPSEEA
jgi:hypothetical protein